MAVEFDISHFKKFLSHSRGKTESISRCLSLLGVDVRMSEEEKIKYAEEDFNKYLENEIFKRGDALDEVNLLIDILDSKLDYIGYGS